MPLNQPLSLAFATKFMTEATTSGVLRKAYDDNGLKDNPIRTQVATFEFRPSSPGLTGATPYSRA